jgi:hypothetical protein
LEKLGVTCEDRVATKIFRFVKDNNKEIGIDMGWWKTRADMNNQWFMESP